MTNSLMSLCIVWSLPILMIESVWWQGTLLVKAYSLHVQDYEHLFIEWIPVNTVLRSDVVTRRRVYYTEGPGPIMCGMLTETTN